MKRGYYSDFWRLGGHLTADLWAERDADAPSPEELLAWLRLSDAEHRRVVEGYAGRRMPLTASDRWL